MNATNPIFLSQEMLKRRHKVTRGRFRVSASCNDPGGDYGWGEDGDGGPN